MYKIPLLIITLSISLFANEISNNNSVVKVFTSISLPNYQYPWQSSRISKFTGSGAIIESNRILTSAHVVSSAKFIELKKENDPEKYVAHLVHISHQADLAILELEDKSFFENTVPFKLNENIHTKDEVTVVGYPIGGNTVSTTTGIVSRIEYTNYVWSKENLLAIQIDASINSGNSGGAVINDKNELIGIAMMRISNASNIGYIVPSVVVNYFLEDIKDGKVDGFHSDTIVIQNLSNDSLKKYFSIGNESGVLITSIGIDEILLKVNDIILSVDDYDIANNSTINTKYGRVNFTLPFHFKQLGKSVKLKILREKEILYIDYKLKRVTPLIAREFGQEPRYIIFGGLVFTPLTKNYLNSLYKNSNGLNMLFYEKVKSTNLTEPVVTVNNIFPNKTNRGYHQGTFVLKKVNDINIKDFNHLVSILDNTTDEYTIFEFLEKRKIVLNTKEARDSIIDIKNIYNIKRDRRTF